MKVSNLSLCVSNGLKSSQHGRPLFSIIKFPTMRTQEVYVESPTLTGQEFKLSEQEFQELFSNLKRAFESVCFAQSELAKVLREQEKQAVELEQLKSLILGADIQTVLS